jgi:hypothetical protein
MAGKEVTKRTISANVLDNTTDLDVDTVLAILNGEYELAETDADQITEEIMRRTLSAATLDEVLGETPGLLSTASLVGIPLELLDFSLRPSDYQDTPVYMVVDAVNMTTGEKFSFGTGSKRIMAQIAKLKWLGALPRPVKVVGDKTRAGNDVFRLGYLGEE